MLGEPQHLSQFSITSAALSTHDAQKQEDDIATITASICPQCFAEIPAHVTQVGGKLQMVKSHCGKRYEVTVETDAAFELLAHGKRGTAWTNQQACLLEVTHRCNNRCPNCYANEDRGLDEISKDEIISRAMAIPHSMLCLIGGEPTVRADLPEIIRELYTRGRRPVMYTNGIRLDSWSYVKALIRAGLHGIGFSLHHPDYSAPKVLERKRAALEVLRHAPPDLHLVEHISFSLENEGQVPGILDEIERYRGLPDSFRIRSGYQPENQQWFVSDLYRLVKAEADKRNKPFDFYPEAENNRIRVGFLYDGTKVWLMSWPSNLTIDLAHAKGDPSASFEPGCVQHFCRAVVTQEGMRRGWFNGRRVEVRP